MQQRQETSRLWMSEEQWSTLLARIERASIQRPHAGPDRRGDDRQRYPVNFRCILRLEGSEKRGAGTFLVRTRNISRGGLGFVHHQTLVAGTRCTVALQGEDGQGRIMAGRVVWCQEVMQLEVETPLFQVGVQFDQPIDLEPLMTSEE